GCCDLLNGEIFFCVHVGNSLNNFYPMLHSLQLRVHSKSRGQNKRFLKALRRYTIVLSQHGYGAITMPETLYDLAGGAEGMQRLATAFYAYVFDDPLMLPLFHDLNDDHVGRM